MARDHVLTVALLSLLLATGCGARSALRTDPDGGAGHATDAGARDAGTPSSDAGPPDGGSPDGGSLDGGPLEIPAPRLAVLEHEIGPPYAAHLSVFALETDEPTLVFEEDVPATTLAQPGRTIAAPRRGGWFVTTHEADELIRWSADGRRWRLSCSARSAYALPDRAVLAERYVISQCPYDGSIGEPYSEALDDMRDVVVDDARGVVWALGDSMWRLELGSYRSARRIASLPSGGMGVDVAEDGSVWMTRWAATWGDWPVEHRDPDGRLLATFPMRAQPRCIRVHRGTGDVWVTEFGVTRIDRDGVVHVLDPDLGSDVGDLWSIAPDHDTTGAWVSGPTDEVRLVTVDGEIARRIPVRMPGPLVHRDLALLTP